MKSPQRRPPSSPPTFSRNVGASLPQSSPIPAIKLVRPAVPTFAHDSGASAQSRERDVNIEADELASDDEVRSPTGAGEWRCKWADCRLGFVQQPKLVHHLHTDHIGGGKDVYMCEWSDCMRKGQRQATRHSLITHCRAHTGERPYTCSQSGCGKTFTRSDAMNKHLRSLHGVITEPPNKKKVKEPQTVLTQQPLTSEKKFEWTPSSDADLLEDEEVAEVLPRLRRREMFWSTTEEDHRLVKAVRDRHPRGGHKGKGRDEDSDDSFDEGVGARYPVQPGVVGMMADQDEAGGGKEVDVMGRPRWQVRYIMGKAKLMLVEEENSMRRRELRDLMELERRMQAGEA